METKDAVSSDVIEVVGNPIPPVPRRTGDKETDQTRRIAWYGAVEEALATWDPLDASSLVGDVARKLAFGHCQGRNDAPQKEVG